MTAMISIPLPYATDAWDRWVLTLRRNMKYIASALSVALIFGASNLDEHTTVPLWTAVSVCATLLVTLVPFTFTVSRKLQAFLDKLDGVVVRLDTLERKFEELDGRVETLADIRAKDMERLRLQLKTGSLLESQAAEEAGLRILVVDDNKGDRDLLKKKLSPVFMVDEASTLAEGARRFAQGKYDCVLLDLALPDARSHKRTVADFSASHPEAMIIVLTGNEDPRLREAALAQGADDVWIKGKDDVDLRIIGRKLRESIWLRRRTAL